MAANALGQMLEHGQSPWIDNITRGMLEGGELQRLIDLGVVGLTSNPTIFQKAIGGSGDYDRGLADLVKQGKDLDAVFEGLVLADIAEAARILRPVFDRSGGRDGYVSIEVSPELAYDTARTVDEARRYVKLLATPNIMIKVPGTVEGVSAFRALTGLGINVNVTLLFSLVRYREVAQAYVDGLEALDRSGNPVSAVSSVASFFVSRVDTAVDGLLEEKATDSSALADRCRAQLGKAAIANAKLAYAEVYGTVFDSPRWSALAAKGALRQRPLWASTSTKNPAYRDVVYVEELIGNDTVNTMPPSTVHDFLDHGRVRNSLVEDVEGAVRVMGELRALGVDMDQVTDKLQKDGVNSFAQSFRDLLHTIEARRQEVAARAS